MYKSHHFLFSTHIIEYDLSNYLGKNNLLDYINKNTYNSHDLIIKGKSSHSIDNILDNPLFYDLKNLIQTKLNNYSEVVGIRPCHIKDNWYNILDYGGKVKKHIHGYSVLSGAYYPLLKENSCNLIFYSPLKQIAQNLVFKNDINHKHVFPVKQDHLYIFPSYLEHSTETNRGDKRIVISFNT